MNDLHAAPPSFSLNRRSWLVLAAVSLALLFFVAPLSRSGLWDPYELGPAEFARRIGLAVLGGQNLLVPGAENGVPHLNDLGRGQAQDTWVGLGFRLFGLHPEGGRAMLAASGLLAVCVQGAAGARVFGRKTGLYSALVLACIAPFLLGSKLLLGEGLALQCYAVAFAAALVLVGAPKLSQRENVAWGLALAAGLTVGFIARGAHVAVPVLGALVLAHGTGPKLSARGRAVLALCGASATAMLGFALRDALRAPHDLSPWLGMLVRPPVHAPTFDVVLGRIAHGAAPWSALAPLAAAALLSAGESLRTTRARRTVLLAAVLSFGVAVADGYLREGGLPYLAWGPLAMACGLALADLDLPTAKPFGLALSGVVIAALVHHDLHGLPDKAVEAYGLVGVKLPAAFAAWTYAYFTVVLFAFSAALLAVALPTPRSASRPSGARVLHVYEAWRGTWGGMLAAVHLLVAGAFVVAAVVVPALRLVHLVVPTPVQTSLQLLAVGIGVLVGPFFAAVGAWVVVDLWAWAFDPASDVDVPAPSRGVRLVENLFSECSTGPVTHRLAAALGVLPVLLLVLPAFGYLALHNLLDMKPLYAALVAAPLGLVGLIALGWSGRVHAARGAWLLVAGVGSALLLGGSYYPGIADAVSPRDIFVEYSKSGAEGSFAVFGISSSTAAYYLPDAPTVLSSSDEAAGWIRARAESPWYLGVKVEDLPRLNQAYRKFSAPQPRNLPILRGGARQTLLASNRASGNGAEGNPLDAVVTFDTPSPKHVLNVQLEGGLEVLGYDYVDSAGRNVETFAGNGTVRVRVYYAVKSAPTAEWERFVHIDGRGKHQTADGKLAAGGYPSTLWLPGDVIVDAFDFKLDGFAPGTYEFYFGLWQPSSTARAKVLSGPSDGDNRIRGGALVVK